LVDKKDVSSVAWMVGTLEAWMVELKVYEMAVLRADTMDKRMVEQSAL
jgi:hypothetical protein